MTGGRVKRRAVAAGGGSLFGAAPIAGYAIVAVERGVDRWPDGLTYSVPPELAGLQPGERVRVPLGRGDAVALGWVVRVGDAESLGADGSFGSIDPERVKAILARDSQAAPLPRETLDLARWISSYYCCPIGLALAGILPAAVKKRVGLVTRHLVDVVGAAGAAVPPKRLGPKQRAVLEFISALPEGERPVELHELARRAGVASPAPVRALISAGLLTSTTRTQVEAEWFAERLEPISAPEPTAAQQAVIDAIVRGGAADGVAPPLGAGFTRHLLYGVTGSGKTEVYVRLIERTLALGKRAILLVPEISLTPQTGARIIGRFPGVRVAVLHSGLTEAQRHQQWALVAEGHARIVLGARSAVFAPIPDASLGLIVVDEEHDASYKQDQQPRYHGRDVAIRRAQLAGCTVVLGSATPSLESWLNAQQGHYTLHRLMQRAPGLTLPRVEVVDFVEERRHARDRRVRLLGPRLEHAVRATLDADGQVLLLLNRRGYGNYIACPDHACGWIMQCDHCDAAMICHQTRLGGEKNRFVRCHHCLEEQRLPKQCPECGKGVTVFGLGTQRVEEELGLVHPKLLEPGAAVRVDGDTMRTARDFHETLGRFGRGEIRLLVGTQMIAKGLDFPGVRLVGVVNADTAINLPDFRASERTHQLVAQVVGRCGRGAAAGSAIIQSFQPHAPAISFAAAHDFEGFAKEELAVRKRFGLPPWRRLVRLVVRDEDEAKARTDAQELRERLELLALEMEPAAAAPLTIRGPVPCALARIADRWRMQIELLADSPQPLQKVLAAGRNSGILKPGESLVVDVDPTSVM